MTQHALPLTLLKCGANLFALDSGAETFSVIIFESALKLKLKLKLKCATSQGHHTHTLPAKTTRPNHYALFSRPDGLARHLKLKQIVNDAAGGV